MAYHIKILGKMQRRAMIWILGAFKTSPSYSIEAIAGLIPIKLHLQKLGGRSQLQASKLSPSHLLCLLIDLQLNFSSSNFKAVALDFLTNRQCSLVKGHLVDMANRSYECFPSFAPLNSEFSPSFRIIDNFSDCISFNVCDKEKDIKLHAQELDNMVLDSSLLSSSQMVDLFFFLSFLFSFFFSVYFPISLFLEQLGLGLIGHAVTTVT